MPNPTLTPDPTPLKSANLFEAIEAIKYEFPKHCDWSEVDYYFDEMHADSERNRKAFANLKIFIQGMDDESGMKVILLNQLKQIRL